MAHSSKKRKQAHDFFVHNMMTAKEISGILNVTEKTLGNWRDEDEWDKHRDELLTNPMEVRRILLSEMQWVASGNKSRVDADALSKISKALAEITEKMSPQTVAAVLELLDNFLAEINPQLAVDSLEAHRAFLQHIISLHE